MRIITPLDNTYTVGYVNWIYYRLVAQVQLSFHTFDPVFLPQKNYLTWWITLFNKSTGKKKKKKDNALHTTRKAFFPFKPPSYSGPYFSQCCHFSPWRINQNLNSSQTWSESFPGYDGQHGLGYGHVWRPIIVELSHPHRLYLKCVFSHCYPFHPTWEIFLCICHASLSTDSAFSSYCCPTYLARAPPPSSAFSILSKIFHPTQSISHPTKNISSHICRAYHKNIPLYWKDLMCILLEFLVHLWPHTSCINQACVLFRSNLLPAWYLENNHPISYNPKFGKQTFIIAGIAAYHS